MVDLMLGDVAAEDIPLFLAHQLDPEAQIVSRVENNAQSSGFLGDYWDICG